MFKERLISAIILVIITIPAMIIGGNLLFGILFVTSLIGLVELYKINRVNKNIGIIGYVASMAWYTLLFFNWADEKYVLPLLIGFLMLLMMVYVFTYPKFNIEQVTLVFFGLVYVSIMLSFIYRIRMIPKIGLFVVWLVFFGSWISDTCAYCVGMLTGKIRGKEKLHKLSPKVSPNKSIEGSIGGIIGAALFGAIYAYVIKEKISDIDIVNPCVAFACICAASSVISQIGDLAASAIKRDHEIKDYGKLIPGHGGILDRFDSVIFTAPIVFYLVKVFYEF